jgi:hypothetical protein
LRVEISCGATEIKAMKLIPKTSALLYPRLCVYVHYGDLAIQLYPQRLLPRFLCEYVIINRFSLVFIVRASQLVEQRKYQLGALLL